MLTIPTCLVLLKMVSIAVGAPVESVTGNEVTVGNDTQDCDNENSDVYDQRQNGTENYRIHVNGVVVLVAPPETVLQAAQLGSLQMGAEAESSVPIASATKPKPKPQSSVTEKVPLNETAQNISHAHTHPKDKNNLKLLNLLQMFRSVRHESEGTVEQV